MDHLRHQGYENKQLKNTTLELENNLKSINISINDMGKFEKRTNKEKNIYEKLKIVWIKITTFFKRHISIMLWSFSS